VVAVDTEVLQFFVRHRQPWLTSIARVATAFGSSAVVIPLGIMVGLVARRVRRSWAPLVMLASAYVGGEALFQTLKALVGRARPPAALAIGHFTGTAFPSGHATLSAAVYGAMGALATGARRVAAWAAAAAVAVVVGMTRLYLGAHWLTDVLAGWALGAGWLAVVVVARSRLLRPPAGTSSRSVSP
jgi:undecaprenyl-diphosphatase